MINQVKSHSKKNAIKYADSEVEVKIRFRINFLINSKLLAIGYWHKETVAVETNEPLNN